MKINVDDLIEKRLVTQKVSPCGRYRLFKYSRNVFYDNLWHLDPRIVECRGIVVDEEDNVVLYPFTKVFNYGENETGGDIHDDERVICIVKLNGFLAQAAVIDEELIVTSSGSFTGEFQELAKKRIEECLIQSGKNLRPGFTYMFEICDEADPHIVKEDYGTYLIGVRQMTDPNEYRNDPKYTMQEEKMCDFIAEHHSFKRPAWSQERFCTVVGLSKRVKHEGFMIRDPGTGDTLVKLKSKHYLNKKALMRLGKAKIEALFDSPKSFRHRLDEEFYGVFEAIVSAGRDHWKVLDEQGRRAFIEGYFDAHNI